MQSTTEGVLAAGSALAKRDVEGAAVAASTRLPIASSLLNLVRAADEGLENWAAGNRDPALIGRGWGCVTVAAVGTVGGVAAVVGGVGAVAPQLGGPHASVRAAATNASLGGEARHMPSWAATRDAGVPGATRGNTPTIWMETADHMRTASHSSGGAAAATYRAQLRAMIAQGRYLDAMMMDVQNVRALFGLKYEGAIQQMGQAFWESHR